MAFKVIELKKKFYITTPIYYVNAQPHIGHAYTTIAADTLTRWHRLKEEDVFFLTGTDEHGEKIEKAALGAGKSPQEYVDEVSNAFSETWKRLDIAYSDFIRTTQQRHIRIVEEFIKRIDASGDIYEGEYEGWYCVPDESFWTALQLRNDKCPECGREVEKVKEEAFFFRLSRYKEKLLELYEKNPRFLSPPSRAPEIVRRVEEGLKDLCITRKTVAWAVHFPLDSEHYVYVWLDALINYLSALGWPNGDAYKRFWPADVHLVGKEINWFHSVIWPALLMSAGLEPPKMVFSHGWWTVNGEKMSKSKGNFVNPVVVSDKYSVDGFRYFLLREMPFGEDGDYSEEALKRRINGELVAGLGNLLNRTVTLAEKFDGTIEGKDELSNSLDLRKIEWSMDNLEFHQALICVWEFIGAVNRYINERKPWQLKGSELANVMYNLLESSRILSILISPFMPETSVEMDRQLGVPPGCLRDCSFRKWMGKIEKGRYLFQKIR